MENLSYFERFRCLYGVFVNDTPNKGDIVNYLINVFNVPRSTASKWQKDNDLPDHEVRYRIAKHFFLHTDIWTDNTWTDMINFEQNVEDFKLIIKDNDEKTKTSQIVYGECNIVYNNDEHPKSLYEQALKLKKEEKVQEALNVIEQLLKHESRYVHVRYNKILHLKSILLSHNKIRHFDEAINILQLLYSAMEYHLKNPEVLTLLGSNYKRKAFYDKDGNLRPKDKLDVDYLILSLQNYEQALNTRFEERYYDAINIAYLKKILFNINNHEVDKLCKTESNWLPDENNWWEKATRSEFYMLMGNYKNAKLEIDDFFENKTVHHHDIGSTLRQIQLYIHAVPEDKVAQKLHRYILDCLEHIR